MRTMFEVYCPKCGKEVAVDDTLFFDYRECGFSYSDLFIAKMNLTCPYCNNKGLLVWNGPWLKDTSLKELREKEKWLHERHLKKLKDYEKRLEETGLK